MPRFALTIAEGLDELAQALIAAGNTLRCISLASGEAFQEICEMKASLDEVARATLSPVAQQRLGRTLEQIASPRQRARALRELSALQKMIAGRAPGDVEAFRKQYERRSQRRRAALARARTRKRKQPG